MTTGVNLISSLEMMCLFNIRVSSALDFCVKPRVGRNESQFVL